MQLMKSRFSPMQLLILSKVAEIANHEFDSKDAIFSSHFLVATLELLF